MKKIVSDLNKIIGKKSEQQIVRQLKTNFKEMSRKQLEVMFKDKQPLDNSRFNEGIVYAVDLGSVENFHLTAIQLEPNAQLLESENEAVEYLVVWNGKYTTMTLSDNESSMKNNSDEPMYVLSIQVTNK